MHNETSYRCHMCSGPCTRKGTCASVQLLRCRNCKRYQRSAYRYRARKPGIDTRICTLVKESCGIRSISRILSISPTTVIARIKWIASQLRPAPLCPGRSYEVDELSTFVGRKKNRIYVAYALDRQSREVAALAVGRRTKKLLRSIIDRLLLGRPRRISTDGLDLYGTLIPPELHRVKEFGINRIERMNLTLRTRLKRLGRRTLCFSKSPVMLRACIMLLIWG